ncbi:4719_t:CDS:1, partial [Ambispora gerdemannii]
LYYIMLELMTTGPINPNPNPIDKATAELVDAVATAVIHSDGAKQASAGAANGGGASTGELGCCADVSGLDYVVVIEQW